MKIYVFTVTAMAGIKKKNVTNTSSSTVLSIRHSHEYRTQVVATSNIRQKYFNDRTLYNSTVPLVRSSENVTKPARQ